MKVLFPDSNPTLNENDCLELVQENGLALHDVPMHMRTSAICLAAMRENNKALKFVPENLKVEVINAVTVKSIVANDCFAIEYFPKGFDLQKQVDDALASVKYISLAGPSSDAEVRDAHLIYAHEKESKKQQIASLLYDENTTKSDLLFFLDKIIKGSNSFGLHLTLIGHAFDASESLGGLSVQGIVSLCEKYPSIKHIKLLGCNAAQAQMPAAEVAMRESYIEKKKIKDQLHYGLVTTSKAPSNNKEFQQRCLKFCVNNNLQGVYVLSKIEEGDYQLFSMKHDESSHTIIEKVRDIRKPQEIQNILKDRKPFIFPKSNIFIPLRQKGNILTSKELMALRDLTYEGNRFEKNHPHYKKDKNTYPFLATIKAELKDLKPSLLKKIVDEINERSSITWNISIKASTKLIYVDTARKNFTVTNALLYDSKQYNKSLFYHPETSMVDYHDLQKDRQQSIRDMSEKNPSGDSSAKQLKILITPQKRTRKLNYWEESALKELSAKGLTADMFFDRYDTKQHEFKNEHYFALLNLINDRGFTLNDAFNMFNGLSTFQVHGIKEGLLREDVINLTNLWHIAVMILLKSKGLTSDMLLTRNEGGHSFDSEHLLALDDLVRNRNFTIKDALREIDGLSNKQADSILGGLTREDVIRLTNVWHISALRELKGKGLTADMLLTRNEGGHKFESAHCFALEKLVRQGYTIDAALKTIDGLSFAQASDIHRYGQTLAESINQDSVRKCMPF